MAGSECIGTVSILPGLTSVSDCPVMAIIGFGFEVLLHNKQWALRQKSLWFVLTYRWLNITSDFPSYSFPWSSLYAFWMNHVRRTSVITKNLTCGPFVAAENILRPQSGPSTAGGVWRPGVEQPERKGSPAHTWISRTKGAPPKWPFRQLQGRSVFITDYCTRHSLGWKHWRRGSVAFGRLSLVCSPWLLAKMHCVQTTLRIQCLRCSKLISSKYQIIVIYKFEKDICVSFYICILK